MPKALSAILLLSLLVGLASVGFAQAQFSSFDDAQKSASSSGKPVFLVVITTGQRYPDPRYDELAKKAENDEDAQAMELARVNILITSSRPTGRGQSPYSIDEKLQNRFGGQGTCALYAPGANRPMWVDAAGSGKSDVFKTARKAYDSWRAEVDKLEAAMKDDKDLRKDPEALHKLASTLRKGFVSAPALKVLDDAIRAARKVDRDDPRQETWSQEAGAIALECHDWDEAIRRFTLFRREYKESKHAEQALVGIAKAQLGSGDYKAAKATAESVSDEASGDVKTEAAGVIAQAQRAMEE